MDWVEEIKQYEYNKRNTEIPVQPVVRVRYQDVKLRETLYNPITQKYSDPYLETKMKEIERQNLIDTLAKNKDRVLRYEQIYDIINLESKLKGLENKPNFPVEQPPKYDKKDANSTNADYNILSNKKFREHHFLSPELRPLSKKVQQKVKKMTTTGLRNYNIITNRYLENNEQKLLWDDYIQKQESALKYWNSHDYNPILAQFYQKDKEEEFQQKRVEEAKMHGLDQIDRLPDGIKYSESALFQPINGIVVDEKKLYDIDMKKKIAKQRYETRYDLEQEYHLRDIEEQERQANRSLNKQFHNKYVQDRERGYNILTNANFVGKNAQKLWDPQTKPTPSVWDQIIAYRQTQSAIPSVQQQQANSIFNRQFSQTSNDQQVFKQNEIQSNQSNREFRQSLQPQNSKIHQIVQQQNDIHLMTPSPSIKYINQGKQMNTPQSRNMKIQTPKLRSSLQDFNRKELIQTPVDNKRNIIPAIVQRNIRTSGILK